MKYIPKIMNVLRKDGVFALIRKISIEIRIRILPYFDLWFDVEHGVDTCEVIFHDGKSDLSSDDKKTSVRYEATPVKVVRSILSKLSINHSDYTFIDYGSGKGRVLLLASEYPFKRIIGVELSKHLHIIADKNIRICKHLDKKCADLESRCIDATEFSLPNNPLVIFFFTPFLGTVMDHVANNIQESLRTNPRPVHIIYYGSRTDIIKIFSDKDFAHQEVYTDRPLSASGSYRGHLFSSISSRLFRA